MKINNRIKSPDEFIKQCIEIHGDKYDYSKTIYTGCMRAINITCDIHGDFVQKAGTHLSGSGCKHCRKSYTKSTRTTDYAAITLKFITKAIIVHKNNYDYINTVCSTPNIKVRIGCPIHGEFLQVPRKHLNGSGCPQCAGNIKKTQAQFITEASIMNNFKYDYSNVIYNCRKDIINIICPFHGEFKAKAGAHLKNGHGCPKCSKRYICTTDEFIKKASVLHNNYYTYSNTIYVNVKTKIIITCPIHGDFHQRAGEHIKGRGCKYCAYAKHAGSYTHNRFALDKELKNKPAMLYLIKINDGNEFYYKIGITTTSLSTRFSPKEYKHIVINPIRTLNGTLYEMFLLEQYILQNVVNEFTKPSDISFSGGASECFIASTEELHSIINIFDD